MASSPFNLAQAADLIDKSIQNIWLKSAGMKENRIFQLEQLQTIMKR